jgi:RNA polymerase-binding transcription factor DksA
MAKKSTAKKTVAKKADKKKPVKTKAVEKKKSAVSVKKAASKPAVKKIIKKNAETKKVVHAKTITKPKSIEKKIGLKTAMPRKKVIKEKAAVVTKDVQPAAEERIKPVTKIKGYGQKDLEHFRQIILAKRDEIIEQLQNLKEQMLDPTTGEYINENSPYSLHMAEQGTDAMEREKTFLYAQRENKFLGYLEDALKRIDSGTYGICLECIDEPQHLCDTCPLIPKARLEAVPHSQLCLPIKQRQEKR